MNTVFRHVFKVNSFPSPQTQIVLKVCFVWREKLDCYFAELTHVCLQFILPHMKKKPDMGDPSSNGELLSQYWAVDDIYKFENLGFSNTVDNTKYLVCADCEVGPLGWHDLVTKISYISLKRVNHQ